MAACNSYRLQLSELVESYEPLLSPRNAEKNHTSALKSGARVSYPKERRTSPSAILGTPVRQMSLIMNCHRVDMNRSAFKSSGKVNCKRNICREYTSG